jgi:chromosome segregation ATPase
MRFAANSYKMHNKKLTEENEKLTINMNAYGLTAKRLGEENERLKSEVSVKRKLLDKAEVRIECVEEENNQLKADICNAEMNLAHITKENEKIGIENFELICKLSRIKEDTVRKMQERFTLHYGTYTDKDMTPITEVFRLLDQIVKEMLEGDDG